MRVKSETDKLIFWGTRGGLPSGEITSAKYGLATCCVGLVLSDRHVVFDAGSGISLFGNKIETNDIKPIDIFIGHYHYDHLIGLPFFTPLFNKNRNIRVFLPNLEDRNGIDAIDKLISPPLFPISREMFSETVSFHSFFPGDTIELNEKCSVETSLFPHPGQNCGFRFNRFGNKTICYISDVENNSINTLENIIEFTENGTHLIIDSSYTQEELKSRRGWGHLSLDDIEFIAAKLPQTKIFLYHHDIFKSDQQIEEDSKGILYKHSNVRLAKQFDAIKLP